jgi:hypothetical protein
MSPQATQCSEPRDGRGANGVWCLKEIIACTQAFSPCPSLYLAATEMAEGRGRAAPAGKGIQE